MREVKIRSKYNENEEFDYRDTPKIFRSVTNKTIQRLRAYCLKMNRKESKDEWKPGTLKAMLESVAGRFEPAHQRLVGDYSSRLSNLENAYVEGIADLNAQIIEFENQVSEHSILFEEYQALYKDYSGESLPSNLAFKEKDLEQIKNDCSRLEARIDEK